MGNYYKRYLSGVSAVQGLVVSGISSPTVGVLVHAAVAGGAGSSKNDEVHIWAQCQVTVASVFHLRLNITSAGASFRDIRCETTGDGGLGLYYVVPGIVFSEGVSLRAYVTAAGHEGQWALFGHVIRYLT